VLNIQLKELEQHELVSRKIYPVMPPKVEYELTDFGKSLIPVISAIGFWGDEHQERLKNLILNQLDFYHVYFTGEKYLDEELNILIQACNAFLDISNECCFLLSISS